VLCVDISRENYPFDFMIMSYINGENVNLFSSKNAKSFYKEKGKLFKKIHSFTSKKAGVIDFVNLLKSGDLHGTNSSWNDFFYINLKNHIQQAMQIGAIDKKQEKYIQKLFIGTKCFFKDGTYSLLHNDPSIRNLKAIDTHVVGIFDWEDAIFGDPLWEIAFIHTFLFREEDKEKFEAFCEGYGVEINELTQNIGYWKYYLRIALLKTINRYSVGYYNAMGFEIDKNRIQYALEYIRKV
jgi:thiamine kinase-like enzyme